jgi:steroid delta-isomerase-like uncharacterized protein
MIKTEKRANAQRNKANYLKAKAAFNDKDNDGRSAMQSVIKQLQLASFQQDASLSEAPDLLLRDRRTALVALGSLVLGACGTGDNGGENHRSDTPETRNKTNYLAAKAAFNARDLDSCLAHYAPDHQIMSTPTPPGREHIRAFFEGTLATWPDIQIVVQNALAEDDWVMGRSISTATHSATVLGVPATGKKIETSFWDLHRFDENGLIAQTWSLIDSLTIMKQLGIVP